MTQAFQQELRRILYFVGAIWFVFLLEFPIRSLVEFGLVPRTLSGMIGIVTMPFLHSGFAHLIGNTLPLVILLFLLAGSKARSWEIVASIIFFGGGLLWLFGRPAIHIGASGLVYGLIAFLIVAGFLERRLIPSLVAILVGFLYGSTLIWGVIPGLQVHVSWDGHLWSATAGIVIAFGLVRELRHSELKPS